MKIAVCRWAILVVLALGLVGATAADNMKLKAVLIWGTNEPADGYPEYKKVDEGMRRKLAAVFKWNNYLEVKRRDLVVPVNHPQKVEMSRDCHLEVAATKDSQVQVKLYGKGKLVINRKQSIKPGETIALAGDDKNDTAWFVVLSQPNQ